MIYMQREAQKMIRQNLHCHTTYDDGRDAPHTMVLAAYKAGLSSIGKNAFTGCGSGSYIFRLPGRIQQVVPAGPAQEGGPDVGSFDGCEAILYAAPGFSGDGYTDTRHVLEAAGYPYITDLPAE